MAEADRIPVSQRLRASCVRLAVTLGAVLILESLTWCGSGFCYSRVHHAVSGGDPRGVLRTLDRIGRDGIYGNIALKLAAEQGKRAVLEAVLPRTVQQDRTRALRQAVAAHHPDMIAPLARANADLNVRDGNGRNLLMVAAAEGHRDSVAGLLDAGADPRLKDPGGKTARDHVLDAKAREIVHLIDLALQRRREYDRRPPR